MHANDDSRSNCRDASIATEACGVGDQMARRPPGRIQPQGCPDRSVATATGFTQMLRASSSRAAGCRVQGTSADTLIVRRQRDDVHEPLSAMPNATGHHTGSPILQADKRYWAADHAPAMEERKGGNSQETGPGKRRPDTGMGRAAGLGASGLHGAHPHTIRRSRHVHAPRHAPSRRVSSERGRR